MSKRKTGKTILSAVSIFTAVSGFLVDWNRTHLFNPRWTPHAKFHDAMSISMAGLLGIGSLILLNRKAGDQKFQLRLATLLPAVGGASMAVAAVFPGAKGLESEFPELVPRFGKFWLNESVVGLTQLALLTVGYNLAKTEIRKAKLELPRLIAESEMSRDYVESITELY